MHQLYAEQQQRLQHREQVAEKNSRLADAAYQAGYSQSKFFTCKHVKAIERKC